MRISRFNGGGVITPSALNPILNQIESAIREATLRDGPGYTLSRSAGSGSVLRIAPSGGGAASPSPIPFDITATTSGSTTTLTLWPGTINGLMPSNMFDALTVNETSLWYLIATVTTNGSAVTGIVMSASTTAPVGQTAAVNAMPSTVAIAVGVYKAGIAYNIAGGNITMTPNQFTGSGGSLSGVWAIS